jgi:hypothetical protein
MMGEISCRLVPVAGTDVNLLIVGNALALFCTDFPQALTWDDIVVRD